MKYGQGHWKWYEQAQWIVPPCKVWHLSHLWCLRNSQCQSFWQARALHQQKTCQLSHLNTHQHHTNLIVHNLINVCSNHTTFKLRGQESKTYNLLFTSLTHLWPRNKVKVIKPTKIMQTPSKVIIMKSLRDLALMVSKKKPTLKFYFKWGNMSIILNICEIKNSGMYSWSTWCNQESHKFNLIQ